MLAVLAPGPRPRFPGNSGPGHVARILPAGQRPYPSSRLLLAADLADSRSPREELRAAELVHEVASDAERAQR